MADPLVESGSQLNAGSVRNHARAAGIFYLITFAASIPAGFLVLGPVLDDTRYIVGEGADSQVLLGGLLEFVNALACIGTAVAVFPVVKRFSESLALGFVMSRMLEAAVIMTGVVSLLAVVTLRQDYAGVAGTDPATLTATGRALVAVRDWSFLFGPGMMPAINAILFGTLLYRSRLVPRVIPAVGLIGAPLLLTASVLTLFGLNSQTSAWSGLATLPVAAWELSVGLYMTLKGFRRTPLTPE